MAEGERDGPREVTEADRERDREGARREAREDALAGADGADGRSRRRPPEDPTWVRAAWKIFRSDFSDQSSALTNAEYATVRNLG